MFSVTLSHYEESPGHWCYLVTLHKARLNDSPDVKYTIFPYGEDVTRIDAMKAAEKHARAQYEAMRFAGLDVGSNLGEAMKLFGEALQG